MRKSLLTAVAALSLIFTAAGAVAPPASAVVGITATASATTVSEGSVVQISGYASGAKLGSVVALQRWSDGAWHGVTHTTLMDSRRYSFHVTPPRGRQHYRVRKPAQLGQAVATSPTISITVTWHPKVTATTSVFLTSDRLWVTRVTGTAPAYAIIHVQHWDPATTSWVSADGGTLADSLGHYTFDDIRHPTGWRFRLVSEPAWPRLSGYSTTLTAVQQPVPLEMNQEIHIGALVADPVTENATLTLPATVGDLVSVAIDQDARASNVSVTLDGAPVASVGRFQQRVTTFRAPATGTYRLTSNVYDRVSGPVTIWTSTAKTMPYEPFCCFGSQDRPGQILDFSVPAAADDMFLWTVSSSAQYVDPTRSFLDPEGAAIQALYSYPTSYGLGEVYRATTAGVHALRYVAHELDPLDVRDTLRPIATTDATLDGGPVFGGANDTASAGRFRFVVPAGSTFTITSWADGQLITPSGNILGVFHGDTCLAGADGGQYDLIVWTPDASFSVQTTKRCPKH